MAEERLEGETIGHLKPRAAWVYAEDTLVQVARWMRACHQAAADFVPRADAVWRAGGTWSPGLIIVHNDATIHNAAWRQGTLAGFFDSDFAGPPHRSGTWPSPPSAGCPCTPGGLPRDSHADGIRDNAAAGDEASGRLLRQGVPDALDQAIVELARFPREGG